MSSERPDEVPFTWPPEPADLDRIDVLDVANNAGVPAALVSAATVFRRLRRRRVHKRTRHPAKSRPRSTARDAWLLVASGVLIGATLPGIVRTHTSALASPRTAASAVHAVGPVNASGDGAALRAMQSLLRGGAARAAQVRATPIEATPRAALAAPASVTSTALTPPPAAPAPVSVTSPVGVAPAATSPPPLPSKRSRPSVAAKAVAAHASVNAGELPVRKVLQAYERAWTRMDSHAARTLWPSVDARVLQAAFTPVSEQRLQLAACDIGMSGDRALATCLGTLRYRPRSGDGAPRVTRGRWEFELERSPHGWQISTVDQPRRSGP
jgi:hypothetical protein